MEVLIDCYFDKLFAQMERGCLASRYKRRQLVKFFSDVINSCAEGKGPKDLMCYIDKMRCSKSGEITCTLNYLTIIN